MGPLHQALFSPPQAGICVPATWRPAGLSKLTEMNLWAKGQLCSAVLSRGTPHQGPHLLNSADNPHVCIGFILKRGLRNMFYFMTKGWSSAHFSCKPPDQFGTQYTWMSLTRNTLMCDHKLSINVLYALTVKAGSWGLLLQGGWRLEWACHGLFLTKHTSTSLWICQQPDVKNISHFLSFYSKGLISELNLHCLYRRPCQRGNPQPNKCLIHVGDAHKLISGKLHINMPPLLNRPLGFYSGGGATAIQVEKND